MIVYPAIDIKDGQCVRLLQGKEEEVTVFAPDPVLVAKKWQKYGAQILHLVDLDGAFQGRPQNIEAVRKITEAVDIPVQFGGGVREIGVLKELFQIGVAQVVLGTVVVEKPNFLKAVVELYGSRLLVGLDTRSGKIAVKGWKKVTDVGLFEVAKQVEELGVSRIVFTDIERDGVMAGPNIEKIHALAQTVKIPLIASGGISSLEHIKALKELEPLGVEGVIVGRALYEKKFTLQQAIKEAS